MESSALIIIGLCIGIAAISVALLIRERRRDIDTNNQYRRLVEGTPWGIVVFDAETVLFANQQFVDLVGKGGPGSVVGRTLNEVLAPDTAALARRAHKSICEDQGPFSVTDFPVTGQDGAVVSCDVTFVSASFDGKTAVQGAVVAIDGQYDAVAALRETEAQFQRFFEEMPVPMYRTRPDGTIVHANTALATMLGIEDPSNLVGVDASTFYADEAERDRLTSIQTDQGLLENQVSLLNSADGRQIWVRDSSHTIVDEGGQIFEGALIDVTAGQRATQELELRARQQQALAHIGQVALRSIDLGHVVQEAVEQICDVLDVECSIVAQNQEGHGLLTTAVAYNTDSVRRREIVFSYLQEHVKGAADEIEPVQLPSVATADDRGSVGGVSVNVAGRVESYGAIAVGSGEWHPTAQDLSFLVAMAATLGFATERARNRAAQQRLMRSKDEFVASVSHELRTPLTVVAGLAHELHSAWRTFTSSEVAEFISLISDQSSEMTNLIEDLLVVARADIGKVPIHLFAHDLRTSVDHVVAGCPLGDRARITVEGEDIIALVDPVRFRQIVRNLVTNAIRYGGPHIEISVGHRASRSVVSVFDDGIGIPEEHRSRIFDPYERAHSASGVAGSVGLGLTVSQKLTELMDGSIAYSYSGGSLFEASFPTGSGPEVDIGGGSFIQDTGS